MKSTYVYEKIAGGDYMVFLKEFPHVSAVGKTKKEAKENLLADLKEVKRMIQRHGKRLGNN